MSQEGSLSPATDTSEPCLPLSHRHLPGVLASPPSPDLPPSPMSKAPSHSSSPPALLFPKRLLPKAPVDQENDEDQLAALNKKHSTSSRGLHRQSRKDRAPGVTRAQSAMDNVKADGIANAKSKKHSFRSKAAVAIDVKQARDASSIESTSCPTSPVLNVESGSLSHRTDLAVHTPETLKENVADGKQFGSTLEYWESMSAKKSRCKGKRGTVPPVPLLLLPHDAQDQASIEPGHKAEKMEEVRRIGSPVQRQRSALMHKQEVETQVQQAVPAFDISKRLETQVEQAVPVFDLSKRSSKHVDEKVALSSPSQAPSQAHPTIFARSPQSPEHEQPIANSPKDSVVVLHTRENSLQNLPSCPQSPTSMKRRSSPPPPPPPVTRQQLESPVEEQSSEESEDEDPPLPPPPPPPNSRPNSNRRAFPTPSTGDPSSSQKFAHQKSVTAKTAGHKADSVQREAQIGTNRNELPMAIQKATKPLGLGSANPRMETGLPRAPTLLTAPTNATKESGNGLPIPNANATGPRGLASVNPRMGTGLPRAPTLLEAPTTHATKESVHERRPSPHSQGQADHQEDSADTSTSSPSQNKRPRPLPPLKRRPSQAEVKERRLEADIRAFLRLCLLLQAQTSTESASPSANIAKGGDLHEASLAHYVAEVNKIMGSRTRDEILQTFIENMREVSNTFGFVPVPNCSGSVTPTKKGGSGSVTPTKKGGTPQSKNSNESERTPVRNWMTPRKLVQEMSSDSGFEDELYAHPDFAKRRISSEKWRALVGKELCETMGLAEVLVRLEMYGSLEAVRDKELRVEDLTIAIILKLAAPAFEMHVGDKAAACFQVLDDQRTGLISLQRVRDFLAGTARRNLTVLHDSALDLATEILAQQVLAHRANQEVTFDAFLERQESSKTHISKPIPRSASGNNSMISTRLDGDARLHDFQQPSRVEARGGFTEIAAMRKDGSSRSWSASTEMLGVPGETPPSSGGHSRRSSLSQVSLDKRSTTESLLQENSKNFSFPSKSQTPWIEISQTEFVQLFADFSELRLFLEDGASNADLYRSSQQQESGEQQSRTPANRKSGAKSSQMESTETKKINPWLSLKQFQARHTALRKPKWFVFYFGILISLFIWKFLKYLHHEDAFALMSYGVCVARGSAQVMLWTLANAFFFAIPPVLTLAKRSPLNSFLPLDDAQYWHRLSFKLMFFFACTHTLGHVYDGYRILTAPADLVTAVFGDTWGGNNPTLPEFVASLPIWTGLVMLVLFGVGLVIAYRCAAKFRVFWISHYLFALSTIFFLAHGQLWLLEPAQAQYWVGPFVIIYIVHMLRAYCTLPGDKTEIQSLIRLNGNLVQLRIARPRNFEAKAGQFACLNVPSIAKTEWHPFTLTSIGSDDFVEFHIAQAGPWTKALFDIARQRQKTLMLIKGTDDEKKQSPKPWPAIKMKGPYGTPAESWPEYSVIALVGTGVGMTPMMSILRSILQTDYNTMFVRRVFVLWTVKASESLAWLDTLLQQVLQLDKFGIVTVQRHVTQRPKCTSLPVGPLVLSLAKQAAEESERHEWIASPACQVKQTILFGRPDLKGFLRSIVDGLAAMRIIPTEPTAQLPKFRLQTKVGVFFCGNDNFGRALQASVDESNMVFTAAYSCFVSTNKHVPAEARMIVTTTLTLLTEFPTAANIFSSSADNIIDSTTPVELQRY
eukprot:g79964.t1